MNSKNSKNSDPRRLILNCTDKIHVKRNGKYFVSSNLSICYEWKNIKSSCKKRMNLKH